MCSKLKLAPWMLIGLFVAVQVRLPVVAAEPGGEAAPEPAIGEAAVEGRETPQKALSDFLAALELGNFEVAFSLIAPSTKLDGDPIAYRTPVDMASLLKEVGMTDGTFHVKSGKFVVRVFGEERAEGEGRVRIMVTFDSWDRDEALLLKEGGRWFVGDPIHLIR